MQKGYKQKEQTFPYTLGGRKEASQRSACIDCPHLSDIFFIPFSQDQLPPPPGESYLLQSKFRQQNNQWSPCYAKEMLNAIFFSSCFLRQERAISMNSLMEATKQKKPLWPWSLKLFIPLLIYTVYAHMYVDMHMHMYVVCTSFMWASRV